MRACNLAVTIDGWEADGDVAPTRRPDEPITGTVHVWVTEPLRCEGLDVGLELRATQRGYALPPHPPRVRIFSGRWEPGEHDYRFELRAPELPTREGPLVGWRWLVVASADIPLGLDPRGEAELRVAPPSPRFEALVVRPSPRGEPIDAEEQGARLWASVVLLCVFLLVSAAGFGLESSGIVGGTLGAIIEYAALGIAALFGLWVISDWIALRRIRRRPTVQLRWSAPPSEDGSAPASGTLRCEVRWPLDAVQRVVARLEVKERIRWREHRATTDRYIVHEDEAVLARTQASLSHDVPEGLWTGEIPLPQIGDEIPPYTLEDERGRGLSWQLQVQSHRRGQAEPDVQTIPLTVRPSDEPAV